MLGSAAFGRLNEVFGGWDERFGMDGGKMGYADKKYDYCRVRIFTRLRKQYFKGNFILSRFYSFFVLILITISVLGQNETGKNSRKPDQFDSGRIVIIHENVSMYPEKINVKGTILEISRGTCGGFCIGGVIKVKLHTKIEYYADSVVYIVTACLSDDVTTGVQINVSATQLTRHDNECYYQTIHNSFNSKGIPFYKLSEQETQRISEKN